MNGYKHSPLLSLKNYKIDVKVSEQHNFIIKYFTRL